MQKQKNEGAGIGEVGVVPANIACDGGRGGPVVGGDSGGVPRSVIASGGVNGPMYAECNGTCSSYMYMMMAVGSSVVATMHGSTSNLA